MVRLVTFVALALLIVVAGQVYATGLPKVNISGVIGGAHWMWVEAENASAASGGGVGASADFTLSGYCFTGGEYNPNEWFLRWTESDPASWIQWGVNVPAAMTAPKVLIHQRGNVSGEVMLDGSSIGTYPTAQDTPGWTESSVLSSIPAPNPIVGVAVLKFQQAYGYCDPYIDGFLLYDGNITAAGHPYCKPASPPTTWPENPSWMQANMTVTMPIIAANSVTPQFNVTDPSDGPNVTANYYISTNGGAPQVFVPGTTISSPGKYRVWAVAYSELFRTIPSNRVMGGVDFEIAPRPSVQISGLDGAAHWLWFEAENASSASSGSAQYSYVGYPWYSGMSENKGNNPNLWRMTWNGAWSSIGWGLTIPAAMTAPKLFVQMNAQYTMETFGVHVDGNPTGGTFVASSGNNWSLSNAMSPIAAGNHSLSLDALSYGYTEMDWDGCLLYDGDISLSGHPTTPGYAPGYSWAAANPSWMQTNMTPNTWKTISGPVTPMFTVSGDAGGVSYWLSRNGVVSAYTPGTTITQFGRYRIWAEAYGTAGFGSTPGYERVLAGADFVIPAPPPKPSVSISGLNGASHWLWVEAENATSGSSGGPTWSYVGYPWYSGMSDGMGNSPNLWRMSWNGSWASIGWDVAIPAAMTAPKLLVQMDAQYTMETFGVNIDGLSTGGTFAASSGINWSLSNAMSPITSGNHNLSLDATSYGYTEMDWDGILLYDGDISLSGHPTTPGYGDPPDDPWARENPSWMQANMTPNTTPLLSATSVTPVFTVTGVESGGVSYWMSKDGGAKEAYVPGTPISSTGTYRVWSEAWAGMATIQQKRILAGADFQLYVIPTVSILDAKLAGDGADLAVDTAVVSAVFDNYFYIQDGQCGIRVAYPAHGLTLPVKVKVNGKAQTNGDMERYIAATSIEAIAGSQTVLPMALVGGALGGGDFQYADFPSQKGQVGVQGGTGLNNIGLLVTVSGRLKTRVSSTRFIITDGSGRDITVESLKGMGSVPGTGNPYLAITGASSCEVTTAIEPVVRVGNPAKMQVIVP